MLRDTKFLRWADLQPVLGLSRMTVYRMEKAGTFPKRIQINSGSVGWLENEVEVWLADRIPEWGQLAGCQIELSQLAGGQLD